MLLSGARPSAGYVEDVVNANSMLVCSQTEIEFVGLLQFQKGIQ
jgi:hypothetical protein